MTPNLRRICALCPLFVAGIFGIMKRKKNGNHLYQWNIRFQYRSDSV